ncbi:MAG: hypothetical protein ACRD0N_16115 [Acidimicrobiales bacterium]
MSASSDGLREVRVQGFPLDVYQRATEAFEGLRREFTLMALSTSEAQDVPDRLLRLIEALTGEFAGFSEVAERARDEAIERGEAAVDLVYHLPPAVADACVVLSQMLDEADEFCRRGELLLSLASTPEAIAFRRWYLGEFVAQLAGAPPVPWPEADVDALLREPTLRRASAS